MRACSVEGCEKRHYGRGYCKMHWLRWYRHGETRQRDNYGELQPFINKAMAYDGTDCLLWPYSRRTNGYGHILYNGQNTAAHRLVCKLVYGDPPSPELEAAHACGNRLCVTPKHLRWATRAENMADAVLHGTATRGEKHGMAKLTAAAVRRIRAQPNRTGAELAREFGVSQQTISGIRKRRSWAHLEFVSQDDEELL